jgi:hypothetical protein
MNDLFIDTPDLHVICSTPSDKSQGSSLSSRVVRSLYSLRHVVRVESLAYMRVTRKSHIRKALLP